MRDYFADNSKYILGRADIVLKELNKEYDGNIKRLEQVVRAAQKRLKKGKYKTAAERRELMNKVVILTELATTMRFG